MYFRIPVEINSVTSLGWLVSSCVIALLLSILDTTPDTGSRSDSYH